MAAPVTVVKPWDPQATPQTPEDLHRFVLQSNANLLNQLNALLPTLPFTPAVVPASVRSAVGFFAATGLSFTVAGCQVNDKIDVSVHVDVSLDSLRGDIQLRADSITGPILDFQTVAALQGGTNRDTQIGIPLLAISTPATAGDKQFFVVASGGHATVNRGIWKAVLYRHV